MHESIRTIGLKKQINQFILLQHKKWTQSVQIKTREFSANATSYETTLINSYLPFSIFFFSMTTLLQLGVSNVLSIHEDKSTTRNRFRSKGNSIFFF